MDYNTLTVHEDKLLAMCQGAPAIYLRILYASFMPFSAWMLYNVNSFTDRGDLCSALILLWLSFVFLSLRCSQRCRQNC